MKRTFESARLLVILTVLSALLAACAGQPSSPAAMPVTGKTEFDRQFIQMMVPHHQGALEMAKIAQQRAERPEVKQMAGAILATQQQEIDQMLDWSEQWYGTREVPPMSAMPMLPGMEGMGHGGHSSMDMAADVEKLKNAPEPFDRAFIDAMIEHHQSAVDASQAALAQASRPEIKQLAQAILDAQQKEIEQMKTWRAQWFK